MKPLGWILLGLVAGVLVGGVSPRADLAAERAENGRLEDALAGGDFEGFTVATPAASHVEVAERILAAGRPVLVEKPLATTAEGDAYTFAELEKMATDAGFASSSHHRQEGPPQSVVLSVK